MREKNANGITLPFPLILRSSHSGEIGREREKSQINV